MFPYSDIAKQFTCGKTKCTYIIVYEVAPYVGPNDLSELTDGRKQTIGSAIRNTTQTILSSMKTPRQVNYHPKQDSNRTFLDGVETPFSVGLALYVHKETRNRKIIDCLSELNLTIDYKKVLKIETDIAIAIIFQYSRMTSHLLELVQTTAWHKKNKILKISGGVIGNNSTRGSVKPVLSIIFYFVTSFRRFLQNKHPGHKKEKWLSDGSNKRIQLNMDKVVKTMKDFEINFQAFDCVFNVMTKAILSSNAAEELLRHKKDWTGFI